MHKVVLILSLMLTHVSAFSTYPRFQRSRPLAPMFMSSTSDSFHRKATAAAAAVMLATSAFMNPALATDSSRVGSIPASGFIFKDTLDITSFSDPKVDGVTLYVSDFSKPITERMKGDFFSDPSTASITCVRDGTVKVADSASRKEEGEEVFSEAKSLLFKSVKVRRIIDSSTGNIVYVSFSQKVVSNDDSNKSRFKSSLCAVHIDG